jgi:RHS repeat-associated protein
LLAMTNAAGQSDSYFCDGNGNITDLTDAYGVIAAHYQYDPFGNIINQTGSLQQPYQWSSKETDASTGLVSYLYRFYNPSLGRWQNRDPLAEQGSPVHYASNTRSSNENLNRQISMARYENYLALWQPVLKDWVTVKDGPLVIWTFSIFRTETLSDKWLSRDRFPWAEITVSTNLYNYVNNDPTRRKDPLGLCPCGSNPNNPTDDPNYNLGRTAAETALGVLGGVIGVGNGVSVGAGVGGSVGGVVGGVVGAPGGPISEGAGIATGALTGAGVGGVVGGAVVGTAGVIDGVYIGAALYDAIFGCPTPPGQSNPNPQPPAGPAVDPFDGA